MRLPSVRKIDTEDAISHLGPLAAMEVIGPQNSRGQMATSNCQKQDGQNFPNRQQAWNHSPEPDPGDL